MATMDEKIKKASEDVKELEVLLAKSDKKEECYADVSSRAEEILDGLATVLREAPMREPIGTTDIADLLVKILDSAIKIVRATDGKVELPLLVQAARVGGNLAVDCNDNRGRLELAGYPQGLMRFLSVDKEKLPVGTLMILVASLLNQTVDHHVDVVAALSSREDLITLVELAKSLYTPPEWLKDSLPASIAGILWNIADNIIVEKTPPTYSLSTSEIDLFVATLDGADTLTQPDDEAIDVEDAFTNDLKIISHASVILDRFAEVSKLDQINTEQLDRIAQFIEKGEIPKWIDASEWDMADTIDEIYAKAKGNLAQVFLSVLADTAEAGIAKEILDRMSSWLKRDDRGDLLSIALLGYGNYVRNDTRSTELVSGPSSLLPTILPLLNPNTEVQTQHAVIGLLRNLSIAAANRKPLGEAGVIPKVLSMKPWSETQDLLGSIQGGSISIIKQLVRDAPNALEFLSYKEDVEALIALVKRTNDPPIALEGTRIWINCMRSLAAASSEEGWSELDNPFIIDSVVRLLPTGQKYPLLVNESILGMVYLATFGGCANKVADRLMVSEVVFEGEMRGVDVLAEVISPPMGMTVAPETQANALTLVTQLKSAEVDSVIKKTVKFAKEEQRAVAKGAEKL